MDIIRPKIYEVSHSKNYRWYATIKIEKAYIDLSTLYFKFNDDRFLFTRYWFGKEEGTNKRVK
ncbi:MAG: hypothetical protein NZT61_01480 [Deltaproteobacteria bacterium]|nr:hypothetical protein [Deltaproteobacteria bacterium]MCX7953134.1 hypothetical protein [Deltaproteobacteria bacterium]